MLDNAQINKRIVECQSAISVLDEIDARQNKKRPPAGVTTLQSFLRDYHEKQMNMLQQELKKRGAL